MFFNRVYTDSEMASVSVSYSKYLYLKTKLSHQCLKSITLQSLKCIPTKTAAVNYNCRFYGLQKHTDYNTQKLCNVFS